MSFSHIETKSVIDGAVKYQCYVAYDSIEDSEPYGDGVVDRNSVEEASREYWVYSKSSPHPRATPQKDIPDKILAAFEILLD